MPLNPLVIETDYFEAVQNRKGLMKAGAFDFQFNNITNYINSSIIPLLNQLIANTTPGTQDPNKVGTYLKNVGDGTTDWSNITFNEIPDLSLSFAKLVQSNPCSILATGVDQIFRAVTPLEDRQSLISQTNSSPVWGKITANNIEDRQITDKKIALASLVQANFKEGVLDIQLTNDSVTAVKIQDNTIPTTKIADNVIDVNILGQDLVNQFCGINGSKAILWGNTLQDGFIGNYTFLNVGSISSDGSGTIKKTFPVDYTKLVAGFLIPPNAYSLSQAFYTSNLDNNCIEGYQLIEDMFDGGRLVALSGNSIILSRDVNELLEDESITIEKLPPYYRQKLGL